MITQADTFWTIYEKHLAAQHAAGLTAWSNGETAQSVALRMRTAFERGTGSKNGGAIQATCRELGIKNTYKAIKNYLEGHPVLPRVYIACASSPKGRKLVDCYGLFDMVIEGVMHQFGITDDINIATPFVRCVTHIETGARVCSLGVVDPSKLRPGMSEAEKGEAAMLELLNRLPAGRFNAVVNNYPAMADKVQP